MVPSPDLLLSNIFAGNTSSHCTERRKTKRENGDHQNRCAGRGWESKATDSLAFFTIFVPDPCYYQTFVVNTVQYLVKVPKRYGNKYN
jgi:hypothetical protein